MYTGRDSLELMQITRNKTAAGPVFRRRALRIAWLAAASLLLLLLLGIAINNLSFSRPSRVQFMNTLDRSMAASTRWTLDQYPSGGVGGVLTSDQGKEFVDNAALAHMLVDCAAMSGDSRLRQLAAQFVRARQKEPNLWGKMVDPTVDPPALSDAELGEYQEYQRWMLHGISPSKAPLPPEELADMFAPHKFRTGKATHQLFGLYLYRRFNGDTPELDRLMNGIEERIASEATFDFRVTDLYLQRIAFLLAAGRPDLVKPRWVERALAAQGSDGGWQRTWHGWAPHPLSYTLSDQQSDAHATAQGMWLANMLKYRYPGWIDEHYK